jgi:hypothetical protein
MDTVSAILWTQIPIAVAILIGVYELHLTKKEIIRVLQKRRK